MNAKLFLIIILLVGCTGCVYAEQSIEQKENIYAPVGSSLYNINQKVASYFLKSGIPDGFDKAQYKTAVGNVCYPNPVCKSQAETIFNMYGIDVRKIDGIFSVMLCDREMKWKVMEDLSCNNTRVEILSWKEESKIPCQFEQNWERIKHENCDE